MNELRLEVPRLNPLPFIVADALLVGAAIVIWWLAPDPISPLSLAAIALCVSTGAVALLYPFVVNHARRQEESLQDRANQIEALARTVSASAEQISIAVSNLPAVAENSARQLKAAEQLPGALKAQLAGLQQQLSATANEENAALRHELDTLRSAETTKLVAALDGLSRATADLARLEQLAAQHSAALDHAIAQLPKIADSFGKQASEALHRETAAAIQALDAAAAQAGQALAAATIDARQAFDRGVRDAVTHLATQATSNPPFPAHAVYRPVISAPGPQIDAAPASLDPEASPLSESTAAEETISPLPAESQVKQTSLQTSPQEPDLESESEQQAAPAQAPETTAIIEQTAPVAEETTSAPDSPVSDLVAPESPEPAAEPETPAALAPEAAPHSAPEADAKPAAVDEALIDDSDLDEPEAVPARITEPESNEEGEDAALAAPASELASVEEPEDEEQTEAVETTEPEPSAVSAASAASAPADLALDLESAPAIAAEPALTNDGYTRLIATAYIGIGNKLFIRGDGPGLRRDKGVPLQFVSIGKWRWESAELLFPVKARLYKNDQAECLALGEITLEPGHHHEVTATF